MDASLDAETERTFTMADLQNANMVMGVDDPDKCTYDLGYRTRQAVFACLTCTKDQPAGVCTACAVACHAEHEVVELWTKRTFRCDCGNTKFGEQKCKLQPHKDPENSRNTYNQNFKGLYCSCHRPFPDPEKQKDGGEEEDMFQCIACEDWFHDEHLGEVDLDVDFGELICPACFGSKCKFLALYEPIISSEREPRTVAAANDSPTTSKAQQAAGEGAGTKSSDGSALALPSPEQTEGGAGVSCKLGHVLNGRKLSEAVSALSVTELRAAALAIQSRIVPTSEDPSDLATARCKQTGPEKEGEPVLKSPGLMTCAARSEGADSSQQQVGLPDDVRPEDAQRGAESRSNQPESDASRELPALLLPSRWRAKLCTCKDCLSYYGAEGVAFLPNMEDTIEAYEAVVTKRQEEQDEEATEEFNSQLKKLDHVQQMEILYATRDLGQSLSTYLKEMPTDHVITSGDIHAFFDELRNKRRRQI